MEQQAHIAALQWYIDNGVDEALEDAPVDRYALKEPPIVKPAAQSLQPNQPQMSARDMAENAPDMSSAALGASDARAEAIKLAAAANTLEELREAIAEFEGISLKKTATNIVFSDGNPKAKIMLVGEAPGADEDRLGKAFAGESGHMLDKMLKCIDIERGAEDPAQSIYISNVLNWRPPGNRSPAPGEIEASLPFIERHIQIIKPEILIFCGGVPAKALLASNDGISKLRKKWYEYLPQTPEFKAAAKPIAAIATFHPSYLLKTPSQKKAAWADLLEIKRKLEEFGA